MASQLLRGEEDYCEGDKKQRGGERKRGKEREKRREKNGYAWCLSRNREKERGRR